jgi:hypothetical protein
MHAGVSSEHWSHCPASFTLGTQKTSGSQPSAALEHVTLHIPDHAGLFASISRSSCWNFVPLTPPPATVQTYAGEPAMLVSDPGSITESHTVTAVQTTFLKTLKVTALEPKIVSKFKM